MGCGALPMKDVYDLTDDELNREGDVRPGPSSPDNEE